MYRFGAPTVVVCFMLTGDVHCPSNALTAKNNIAVNLTYCASLIYSSISLTTS